jgi:hypothetical protein
MQCASATSGFAPYARKSNSSSMCHSHNPPHETSVRSTSIGTNKPLEAMPLMRRGHIQRADLVTSQPKWHSLLGAYQLFPIHDFSPFTLLVSHTILVVATLTPATRKGINHE